MDMYCQNEEQIEGDGRTNLGKLSNWVICPEGMVVVGFQTRVESVKRNNSTVLNGVKLICAQSPYPKGKKLHVFVVRNLGLEIARQFLTTFLFWRSKSFLAVS